ncbi:MAG: DUF4845 domain-containing protein [Pseudomonadota bacterium]
MNFSRFLFWGASLALCVLLFLVLSPAIVEYYAISKDVKKLASASIGLTVPEIRRAYAKYVEIDQIKHVLPADLDITKEGEEVVIDFAYEVRIPLFSRVSLLIAFNGSSSDAKREPVTQ